MTSLAQVAVPEAVLKIDRDGAEYELLRSASNETLQKFPEIVMEYHNGYPPLQERLKQAGFQTEIVKEISRDQGILFARRL